MILLSILAALALEHVRPQRGPLAHYQAFAEWLRWIESRFDGGEYSHGVIAWCIAVLPVVAVAAFVSWWLAGHSPVLAWLWNIAVLYATMGFKYYSDDAEAVARLLRAGELEAARATLARMRPGDTSALDADAVARLAIEQVFAASLRQLFGVLFWFVLLSGAGPAGALLYRAASIVARRWQTSPFGDFARRVFHLVNWLPARLVALTFAIAGDFEDAMVCWRTQAADWPDAEEAVVLAAGAGAMGVRLGLPVPSGEALVYRPELGLDATPEADHVEAAVSMVWRGLVVWLAVGVLMAIAGWAT